MRITDALLGEHGVLYAQFEHIERVLEDDLDAASIRELAALLGAALAPHARLEEELLFQPAESAGGSGPFQVMREEHERIDSLLRAGSSARDAPAAAESLRDAIRVARDHFLKEEEIAFPVAEQSIGEPALSDLGRRWANRRAVRLTSG